VETRHRTAAKVQKKVNLTRQSGGQAAYEFNNNYQGIYRR
jgi:hypothetical protein